MKPCINESTTMETDFETDVKAYSKAGFKAIELWLNKVYEFEKKHGVNAAKRLLEENNLDAVSACVVFDGLPNLMLSKNKERIKAIADLERHFSTCRELGVPLFILPTDFPETVEYHTYDVAAENIREISEIARNYKLSLALEFIRGAKFLGSLSTTTFLIDKVDRSNVGILFDFFHFQTGISKLADINQLRKDTLFFVHISDAKDLPREIVTDSDRVLMGEGNFPIKQILAELRDIGYDGYISLELFSEQLWKQNPYDVSKRAYANLTEVIKSI